MYYASSTLKASLLALCALLLFASYNVSAELVAIPPLKSRVTDLTQTLTAEQQSQLEAKLKAFEQQKGSQIAILIVPTTEPEDIAQYSIRVVDAWKLGREKQDDAVLIMLDIKGKKSRIEVGYGLEGVLNDLTAERIRVEVMRPLIRAGDIYGGLNAGVDKIIGLISGENLPPPAPKSPKFNIGFENSLGLFVIGCMVVGAFLSSILGRFLGAGATAGVIGGIAWFIAGTLGISLLIGVMAFIFTLIMPYLFDGSHGVGRYSSGGSYGGGFGSSSRGDDVFSGGGGSFGGGGASGDW